MSVSDLECPEDRFLALAVDRVIAEGFRSPDDFLRSFSPAKIGRAIAVSPKLRKTVLGVVAGFTAQKAAEQSIEQTGQIVDRAFVDGDATPELLLQLFTADDCVRYLDGRGLWHFVADYTAWQRRPGDALPLRRTVTTLLTAAVDENLIQHGDVFTSLGPARLAVWLPPEQLAKLVELALARGSEHRSVDTESLARTVSLAALARAAPPMTLLEKVIVPLLHPRMLAPRAQPLFGLAIELLAAEPQPPPPPPNGEIHHGSTNATPRPEPHQRTGQTDDNRWTRGWAGTD